MTAKSVDWLDVYVRHGAEALKSALPAWSPGPLAATEDVGDGDAAAGIDDLIIPDNLILRAQRCLEALYSPEQRKPGRGVKLRRWDEQWWRHDGTKYCPLSEEGIRADVRPWLNRFKTWKRAKLQALNPAEKSVTELVATMQTDTFVQAAAMPCWLADDFDADGNAIHGRRPWERVLDEERAKAVGLPNPQELVGFTNGLLDVRAWVDGSVRMMPHSERLFTATCLPFECPVQELERVAGDDEALDELISRLCPTWLEFLGIVSGADDEWQELLAQMFGYCLTPWTKYEVVLVMSGATRAGKGTILNGLTSIIGEANVASSDINLLTDKFHLHTLIGKTLCVMPDADVGRTTDSVRAAETLKKISGGDPVSVDRKHKDALAAVRLTCKIVIMCNRMPSLPDPSGAIASRFRVLQFDESFAGKEDLRFKDPVIMAREASGRMMWALRGLRQLARRGKFTQPKRAEQLLGEYRDYSDPLSVFREECLKQDDHFEYAEDLYAVWKKWCRFKGREERTHEWFIMQLRTACPWIDREQRRRDGATRKWGYKGLRIVDANPGNEVVTGGVFPLPPH